MNWYLEVLKKYAVFTGRARRMEYWMYFLGNIIISVIAMIAAVIPLIGGVIGILLLLYCLAVMIPGIAVSIRRLHDTGRSGFWLLVVLVPIIGPIALIIFFVQDSDEGDNQFGPNPKTD